MLLYNVIKHENRIWYLFLLCIFHLQLNIIFYKLVSLLDIVIYMFRPKEKKKSFWSFDKKTHPDTKYRIQNEHNCIQIQFPDAWSRISRITNERHLIAASNYCARMPRLEFSSNSQNEQGQHPYERRYRIPLPQSF